MALPWIATTLAAAAGDSLPPEQGRSPSRHRAFALADANPSAASAPDDATLLSRLATGDEDALRTIMTQHAESVIAIARHVVGSRDTALEVAQEVFVDLWDRRETIEVRGAIGHYVRRAARNRALNLKAKQAAYARREDVVRNRAPVTVENPALEIVAADEFAATVQRVASQLTPRVREVFELYYTGGLEPGEIAALLSIAPRTVYNQLRRAMHVLAESLGVWHDGR